MAFTLRASISVNSIFHIVNLTAGQKMFGIDARRIVAGMTDRYPVEIIYA